MNVKPGDLAIQIKSIKNNDGRVVKIIEFLGGITYWEGFEPDNWLCEVNDQIQRHPKYSPGLAAIPDAWLRPVSGLPLQEDEHTEIKVPA